MKVISLAAACVFALSGCSRPDDARRALEGAGYTNIETGGYAWLDCDGKSDFFATRFTATGPKGHKVSGAVCSGFFKGSTIRTD